jgi:plastocyanin
MRHGKLGRSFGALVLLMATGTARAETLHVKIAQVAYSPTQISAHVGDTIEWDNSDIVAHTATARNGAWDLIIAPNGKASVVLKSVDTIEYYCRFHPNMTGRITVAE